MTTPFKIYKERTFRRTEGVHFADISVPGSNGIDLVEHTVAQQCHHHDMEGMKQFYVHAHQTDHNRVIQGTRLFELVFPGWDHTTLVRLPGRRYRGSGDPSRVSASLGVWQGWQPAAQPRHQG